MLHASVLCVPVLLVSQFVLGVFYNALLAMHCTKLVMLLGQRKRDGVETLVTEIGAAKGMGKGQVGGYKMNRFHTTRIIFLPTIPYHQPTCPNRWKPTR